MSSIEFQEGALSVDAALIGEGLSIDPAQVQPLMRAGHLTSRCEQGIGEDAGRFRLTFFHRRQRLRLIVDAAGNILQRSTIRVRERPTSATGTARADGEGSTGT